MERLKRHADFLRARRGRRVSRSNFTLQVLPNDLNFVRVGFTVTKRAGGAVTRNRIKRRLRAAVQEVFPLHATPGHDYVLLARAQARHAAFDALLDELRTALIDPAQSK